MIAVEIKRVAHGCFDFAALGRRSGSAATGPSSGAIACGNGLR